MAATVHGEVHPAFERIARVLERQVRLHGGGMAICVYHRGRPVVDAWAGTRDDAATPWERDTAAMSFSTTKGVTATLLHVLVDRGLLDYDDPVSKYWPEFGQARKAAITVRQLLCHEAGLHHIRRMVDHGDRMLDWEHMVEALAAAEPSYVPGSQSAYHGLTFGWLIGELAQRVTDRPFAELIRTELALPLGLEGFWIGAPAAARERAARLKVPPLGLDDHYGTARPYAKGIQKICRNLRIPFDPAYLADALLPRGVMRTFWHPEVLTPSIPSANGLFTARDLARLYAALGAGGTLDGVPLVGPTTIARATQVQSRRLDRVVPVAMHWRLGYHRAFTGRGTPRQAFGHFGFGGSGAWTDPRRQLAVAMVNNRVAGSPFGDLRMLAIGAAAITGAARLAR